MKDLFQKKEFCILCLLIFILVICGCYMMITPKDKEKDCKCGRP